MQKHDVKKRRTVSTISITRDVPGIRHSVGTIEYRVTLAAGQVMGNVGGYRGGIDITKNGDGTAYISLYTPESGLETWSDVPMDAIEINAAGATS